MARRPLLSRKKDAAYLLFFMIHLPVMFMVDLVALYPVSMRLPIMNSVRAYYISTYRDRFFVAPPAWFNTYMWMEALYHVPLSVWAIGALWRDDPKVSLHLLIYSCQTAITTLTCISEYLSWKGFSNDEKISLGSLYVPYLALAVFMGLDMFKRLDGLVSRSSVSDRKKTL